MTFHPRVAFSACPFFVPFSRFPPTLLVAHRLFSRHLLARQARPEVEPGVRTISFQPTSLCKHMSSDAECKFA
jgi:hypothetical protein